MRTGSDKHRAAVVTWAIPTQSAGQNPWWLAMILCALLGAMAAFLLLVGPFDQAAVRRLVRASAQTSVLLFSTAFVASSLAAFFPGVTTRWLLRHRRQVGVSFAFSHAIHLLALVLLADFFPHPFIDDLSLLGLVGGGTSYGFIFVMAATSNDRAVAWLGPRRWHLLHLIGGWTIWVIFLQSYLPLALLDPRYAPLGLLVIAAAAMRAGSVVRRRMSPKNETTGDPKCAQPS